MIPTFAAPLFFWGALSLAGLAVIYMLRMRSRRKVVSSLLLWIDRHTADTGGRIWRRMRAPLLFFVELLALALLVLAAADPLWRRAGRIPAIIILDDSYSMRASLTADGGGSGERTVRDAARERLAEILDGESLRARVILAGREPALLKETFESSAALARLDGQWDCWSSTADLDAALSLARQVGGPQTRLLVLTDHRRGDTGAEKAIADETEKESEKRTTRPVPVDPGSQVRWIALGRPLPNLALVGAVRRDSADGGLAVLEIANLSNRRETGELAVALGPRNSVKPFNIEAGDIARFSIPLEESSEPLEASLPPDALDADNRLVLLPEHPPKLRVSVGVAETRLRAAILKVLEADGRCEITDVVPQLRLIDAPLPPRDDCWDVVFTNGPDAKPVLGPFVLDRTNLLLEGVSLEDVVLVESSGMDLPGDPLVMSDTGVLMALDRLGGRARRLSIQFDAEKTTLLDSVDFPALVWNILQWRQTELPEYCRPNVPIGATTTLRLQPERKQAVLERPEGIKNELNPRDATVVFKTDRPGPYAVVLDENRLPLWAHVTFRDESDLRRGATGAWGKWEISQEARLDYRSAAAAMLFLALATWVVHGFVLRKEGERE